ncbi:MAG TPA: alanine racemase, partial [Flavobacterium sp.]|nr:alanine racemase [Flavobacterium sp.]
QMSSGLAKELGYSPLRHILNTGGIVRFPEAQFDMVRLGLGLYGIDTTGQVQDKLQNVSTLKTTISQIKIIPPNVSVGYDRKWKSDQETRIATVGIGYADGYDRRLSNGIGFMLVRNRKAPVVGNICMDMCMIDISKIPEAEEGDEVIVFGNELPVYKIAKKAGTISYEILTGVSSRVKRVYYQE